MPPATIDSAKKSGDPTPTFLRTYMIDRDRAEALFGERLDEALELLAEYDGGSLYAARAKEAAASWLRERSSGIAESGA